MSLNELLKMEGVQTRDSRMLSLLHLGQSLFTELGIDRTTLNNTMEPSPTIKYDIKNTVLPEFVRIDKSLIFRKK